MKRAWFLLLAFSVGLNGALLYDKFLRAPHPTEERGPGVEEHGPPPRDDDGPPPSDSAWRARGEGFMERRLQRMAENLDLTDDQRARIRRIHEASFDEILALRRETREMRDALHQMLGAADFDTTGFHELIGTLHQRDARLEELVMTNLVRESVILTPDQRAKYQDLMRSRRGSGRGRGRR